MQPTFSIITPSFRSSQWLRLCIPSVADQGVELEHIVQDSKSDDGTLDWLPTDRRVTAYVEKDEGMYDAVNRGLKRSTGEILAYINCDEQYLPGALARVEAFFRDHPEIEILFGNVIAVGTEGQFLCYRKIQLPLVSYILSTGILSPFTCATFFRRSVIEKYGLWFDKRYRDQGDADWVVRALRKQVPMALLGQYTSVFTLTGANMNLAPNARRECEEFKRAAPAWLRLLRPLFVGHHRIRRLFAGAYCEKQLNYSIYPNASPT